MARAPAKRAPWSRTKAARRARVELSPDLKWAAGITAAILRDCHPWQREGVIDPAAYVSFLVGRGGAKTTTMRARALIKAITLPRQMLGFAAITADHARELNWDKLKDACDAYGIRSTTTNVVAKVPDVSFLDTKMRMTCNRTGSVYRLRGVEDKKDAEKFRGFPQADFAADECGSFSPELLGYLIEDCASPRMGEGLALPDGWLELLARDGLDLDDPEVEAAIAEMAPQIGEKRGGSVVLGSTPPAVLRGLFYDVTREGSDQHRPYADRDKVSVDGTPLYPNWIGYSSHFWTLKQVVELPNADDYPALQANWKRALENKARKGWSDEHPTWQREYLGRWSADNTATVFRYLPFKDNKPWNEWNPFGEQYLEGLQQLKVAIAALPKDVGTFHYAVAQDKGSRDPFACNVFAFAPRDPEKTIWHVYAFEQQGMYARRNAELLLGPDRNTEKPAGIYGVIGWPDGAIIDADHAFIDEMKNTYGVTLQKAEREANYKFGAIELVNGDLIDGRIKILKGSPLAKQIGELQWKPDDNGNPREDKALANHSTDTLVYGRRLIATMFESGVVADESGASGAPGTPAPPAGYVDPMGLDGSDPQDETEYLLADDTYDQDGWGNG